jgi:hypothetical protein
MAQATSSTSLPTLVLRATLIGVMSPCLVIWKVTSSVCVHLFAWPPPRIPTYPLSTTGQLVFEEGTEATLCTGTMIGTNAVLTAAHCIFNRLAKVSLYDQPCNLPTD